MKQRISMGSPEDRRFEQKTLISLCEIFFSHIFCAFWNLWNVLRKCLDIELLYRYRSLTFSNRLLTKGRPLEARHETKDFNGKPGRPWIWAKKLLISLCEIFFSHIFRALWNLWNVLRKCLDIELLYRYPSLTVFHGLLTKGRPLEARQWSKRFQWEARKTVDLSKKLLISLFEIFFTHIFRAFWKLLNVLRKCLDVDLLYRYLSLMVFHGLLTKGRPLEPRHETKDFNGKPGRPWIWAKNF